jgi:sulfur-oxidizing protein SoxY
MRKDLLAAVLVIGGLVPAAAQDEGAWKEIRANIVGARTIEDGAGILTLEAPSRAEDAALVPITLRLRSGAGEGARVARVTLVVDENPAPVVGTISMDGAAREFAVSTRLRVNSYSFVRALAETEDGRLFMVKSYVKAAGGCSAPAAKDPVEAKAHLGEMRFRVFADRGEAQVQIRHPNYSGLQMDQVTRLYTPAWYVENIEVKQGEKPLLSMTGGISLSEDPTIRFSYAISNGPVTVEARDTQGQVFRKVFPGAGS